MMEYKVQNLSLILKIKNYIYSFVQVCVNMHVCTYVYCGPHGNVGGQFIGIVSLFPPCGSQRSNSVHLSWQQTSLDTETSHWPIVFNFKEQIPLNKLPDSEVLNLAYILFFNTHI